MRRAALDRAAGRARPRPGQPLDTEAAARLRAQGLDPYDEELDLGSCTRPRSRRQRAHDAFRSALARYLAAALGGTHDKNPVQVLVKVPLQGLQDAPGALPAVGASGAGLSRSLVRRWLCDSAVTRLVLGLGGRVIESSHTERTLKSHERRALYAQTGGRCQAAGCSRCSSELGISLVPHHADPWSRCGTTSLADTVLLCASSHADLHEGGRTLLLRDGRRLGLDGWVRP